jgi:VWFA-related protein
MRTLLLSLLLALPLGAQVRETLEVRILELEATVVDRAGRPVEGLTAEDFVVRAGKRDVAIRNFFAVRDGAILSDDTSGPASPQHLAAETSIPTSLVIFIDDVHLTQTSRRRAFEALRRYAREHVGANTTATVVRYTGQFDVLTRPTERPGYVIQELSRLEMLPLASNVERERDRMIEMIDGVLGVASSGHSDVAGESPDTIFYRLLPYAERGVADVNATLRALEKAIDVTASFSGRKVLLVVSDGIPQTPALELFEYWEQARSKSARAHIWRQDSTRTDISQAMSFDCSSAFRRVAEKAQKADVAIYSFDAGGLRGYEGRGVEKAKTLERLNTSSLQTNQRAGLQSIADETGGTYIANENDVDAVLARMNQQFSNYYSIGIAPQRGTLRVTVRDRPDLRVFATRRMPPRSREEVFEQTLRRHLYVPPTDNPLGADVATGAVRRIHDQCVVPVVLRVPRPAPASDPSTASVEVQMVMLNERNDESTPQRLTLPFTSEQLTETVILRVRPEHLVLSVGISNPATGETSFLQRAIDGTTCQ